MRFLYFVLTKVVSNLKSTATPTFLEKKKKTNEYQMRANGATLIKIFHLVYFSRMNFCLLLT